MKKLISISVLLVVGSVAAAAELPAGYKELPYLQSDGVAYIDTGYRPNPATKLDMRLSVMDQGGDYYVFGADDRSLKANMSLWWETYNTGRGGYFETPGSGYDQPTGSAGLTSAAYKDCRLTYSEGIFTLENLDDAKTAIMDRHANFQANAADYEFSNSIYLFARHGSSSSATAVSGIHKLSRISRFTISEGEAVVHDLVPAYSESRVAKGFYDLVTGDFLENAGAGALITEVEGSCVRLSYLGGTGKAFVDTGYVFKTHPRVECLMYLNASVDSDIMGSTAARKGCFIVDYNDQGTSGRIYYRYGNASDGSSASPNYARSVLRKWTEAVFDASVTHDGEVVVPELATYDFSENNQNFLIFRGRYNNQCVRFAYVKVYDGGVLVRDFIPARVDGVAGLWDRLTQTLYTNADSSSTFEEGYSIPASPGDFTVLSVTAAPNQIGTVSPDYGLTPVMPGETITATAVPPADTDVSRSTVAGWEVYCDGERTASGTGGTATFTTGPSKTELRWLWTGNYRVEVSAEAHGSITNESAWFASGESVVLSAVPDEGYDFLCWTDVDESVKYENPLSVPVTRAMNVTALFSSSVAKRLSYIGSTASKQYIETGYVFTNRPAVVVRMMMRDTSDCDFLGMPTARADCFIVDYADGNKNLYYRYANANYTQANYAETSGKLLGQWFDCAWSNIVWHGAYKIVDLSMNDYTGKFATNTQKFRLFGGRSFGQVRYAWVKMYDGDELVRDYIPAKLGGVAGLWDRVERKFYTNAAANGAAFEEGGAIETEPGDFAANHVVTAGEGGSVEVSDDATPLGDTITITAVPAPGHVFAGWTGNLPVAVRGSATAVFQVSSPLDVQANFAIDVPFVVAPDGTGDYTTLEEAVTATAEKSGTILVKSGVYAVTNTLVVSGGVTLVPETGRLGDVTVAAAGDFTVVELSNPLARLSGLVLSNGYTKSSSKGGNLTVTAGTVQNCLITSGRMSDGAAAGVFMTGGVLRDSVIRGNVTVGDKGGAVGVYARGADTLVENCCVCCNTNLMNWQIQYLVHAGGVKLDGATLRHSFVTNNVNLGHGNLYVMGGGRVEDTLVADNVGGFYYDTLSGGGYVPDGQSATFVRTTFARNSGYGVGGLYAGGAVSLTAVKAYDNTAVVGGESGNMDVRGCSTSGIDFTNPDETPVTRVDDVYVPAETADLREAVQRCADGGTVHVAAGTYLISREVVLDRPVRIVGEGSETTVLARDPAVWYTRLVNLRHPEAVLEAVTVRDGQRLAANCVNVFLGTMTRACVSDAAQESPCLIWNGTVRETVFTRISSACSYSGHGSAATLMGAGAVLEDSTFEKCEQTKNYTDGDLVRLNGGRIRRCIFRENGLMGAESCCVGLAGSGVVESSLFTHNDGSWYTGAGFHVIGSGWEVRNCTVVSNLSEYAGAAVYWSTNNNNTVRQGTFSNCIFYRNRCTKDKYPENFDVSAGNGTHNVDVTFRNCLFTSAEGASAQDTHAENPISGDPKFMSLERRNYKLSMQSPCRHAGAEWDGAENSTDLRGRPLSRGGDIDIGCYATGKDGLRLLVR